MTLCGCGKEKNYKRMQAKADQVVSRELDLIKYIQRQRLNSFLALTAFNGRQKFIADKMSTCLIRESSDLNDNSEDDFELDKENMLDIEQHSHKIFQSSKLLDRRLIQAYQCKRWRDDFKYDRGMSSAFCEIDEEDSEV